MQTSKLTDQELAAFNESLGRCTGKGSRFLDRFYELFFESSAEVREKFRRTNMLTQKRMLIASFYSMMLAMEEKPEGHAHFERIAKIHGRSVLDINAGLYDLWLRALLEAVSEYDPLYDAEVGEVWRKMMERGIAYMKAKY